MRFFNPKEEFTHRGSFYGIPLYLKFDGEEEMPIVAGTNIIFDALLMFATWFHNFFIERFAQFFAAISGQEYVAGFGFNVWEMEDEHELEKGS